MFLFKKSRQVQANQQIQSQILKKKMNDYITNDNLVLSKTTSHKDENNKELNKDDNHNEDEKVNHDEKNRINDTKKTDDENEEVCNGDKDDQVYNFDDEDLGDVNTEEPNMQEKPKILNKDKPSNESNSTETSNKTIDEFNICHEVENIEKKSIQEQIDSLVKLYKESQEQMGSLKKENTKLETTLMSRMGEPKPGKSP